MIIPNTSKIKFHKYLKINPYNGINSYIFPVILVEYWPNKTHYSKTSLSLPLYQYLVKNTKDYNSHKLKFQLYQVCFYKIIDMNMGKSFTLYG